MFTVEFRLCVYVAPPKCIQCAWRSPGAGAWDPRGKSWLQGGLSSPLAPAELIGKQRMETVGWRRGWAAWKQMSRGGAGPALALLLTGSGQCPAA